MHVTFLTPTLETAGGTIVLRHYADTLLAAGHTVVIISPKRGEWEVKHPNLSIITYPAVYIRYSDTLTFQRPYWKDIERLIPKNTECIIPIYTPLVVPAIRFTNKHAGAKIVLLAQESMEIPIIGAYNQRLLRKKSIGENLTAIISVAPALTEQICEMVKETPVYTVQNGLDHQIFAPDSSAEKRNEILFVGRPDVTKGYPTFVATVEKLHQTFPDLGGRVAAPAGYKIDHKLIEHTAAAQSKMPELYRKAKVYVNLSTAESFGFPPLEAMACGTPVVTTLTTGSAAYARNQENCLVVPTQNIDATVAAVHRLLSDTDLQGKLVKEGMRTAATYNWESSHQQFLDILTKLN